MSIMGFKSVDQIMGAFTKAISELTATEQKLRVRAEEAFTRSEQLASDGLQDEQEADRAVRLAAKLRELVEVE